MTGVGQFPKFADQAYAVREGEDDEDAGRACHLLPTAEAPVANIHREEILAPERQLPIKCARTVRAFGRRRARRGVGTRGDDPRASV